MALIKCPECSHEVSDTAITCPNCGYALKKNISQEKRASFFESNRKAIIGIVIVVAAIVAIAIVYFSNQNQPIKSPFDGLSFDMTLEEGRALLGEPYLAAEPDADAGTDKYRDYFDNISLAGLSGELSLAYDQDSKKLDHAMWSYELKDGETFEDYEKQTKKMVEFYTEKYGEPETKEDEYIWTSDGIRLSLNLDSDFHQIFIHYS